MPKTKSLLLLPLVLLAAACSTAPQKPTAMVAPPAVAAAPTSLTPSMEVKFAVAGDVMAHGPQIRAAYDAKCDCYNFKPTFATAAPLFKGVDVAIANLETTLPGKSLGATTGWAIRMELARRGVPVLSGVSYQRIDDQGLHILHEGQAKLLAVDHVVLCAGQDPVNALHAELATLGIGAVLIGGAERAEEIDALRAMQQGMQAAYAL